jgi:acyl transferase domain-containing protein
MRDPDTTPPYSATGNGIAILANRISHAFDFAGTSQTIDTGCSASMIAVHQACKSLISGESNVVSIDFSHFFFLVLFKTKFGAFY